MKRYLPIAIVILCAMAGMLPAQQSPHYSMYMFNGLVLNPAYAGSQEHLSATFIYRKQWVGFDGGPSTPSFAVHTPSLDRRHGFGLSMVHDQIGSTRDLAINAQYAYRILLNHHASLSFGLQGTMQNYRNDLTGLRNTNGTDPVQGTTFYNKWLPNASFGAFFENDNFFGGLSAMNFIPNSLADPNLPEVTAGNAQQYAHFFATAGALLGNSDDVKFKPSFLLTYQPAAPLELDLNMSVFLKQMLQLGVSYRTQDAVVLMAQVYVKKALRIGYAYDITTSKLRGYNSGSHEFMVGFDFDFNTKGVTSPRFF